MLIHLKVRDLALVAESTVRFGPGLNLLTGETGSGKSLIIDALSLALGARGGADQVRHGAEKASAEATFDSVVLSRELGKRTTAKVDGRPAAPGQLRELGERLVAIHGQHAHHALLDTQTQTELLDAYAGALDPRSAVAAAHAAWLMPRNNCPIRSSFGRAGNVSRNNFAGRPESSAKSIPRPAEAKLWPAD